jgi:putative acetyltransferase
MHIAIETPDQPEVIDLIAELDTYQQSLYPPESTHLLDLDSLKQPNVIFVVARDANHQAIGCGAVVIEPGYGEVKRMYVHPRGRGMGVAKAVIAKLEAEAVNMNCEVLMLESGPLQPEALGLYERCGFERCGPYGEYWNDPLSVFMQKRIA